MAIRYATAALDFLLTKGSLIKCFEDGALYLYSGTQPANPDMAVPSTSTLLAVVSRGSNTFTPGGPSTRQEDYTKVSAVGSAGDTHSITIDGTAYTFTVPAGSPSTADVARGLAALVEADPNASAISVLTAAESGVKTRSRWGGVSYTISVANTGSAHLAAPVNDAANNRTNGLQWGPVQNGSNGNILTATLSRETANVFSGVAAATGVLGWGRLKASAADPDTQATAYPRMDFSIGSAAADLVVANTNVQAGATLTLDTFNMVLYSGSS